MTLPDAWVERLFLRFAGIYGSQKVAAMWGDLTEENVANVRLMWGQALGEFRAETIAAALAALPSRASGWPPSLPEFVDLCRQAAQARANAEPALAALAAPPVDPVQARANVERVTEAVAGAVTAKRDPLAWARAPRSAFAVRSVVKGAKLDPKLREVLEAHIADRGARMATPEAAAAFARFLDAGSAGEVSGPAADEPEPVEVAA